MSEEKFVCDCGKVCKNLAGLKAHQRACTYEPPKSAKESYIAVAMAAVASVISEDDVIAAAELVEDINDFQVFMAGYQVIKKEFPWNSKDELMRELTKQPGIYRDLYTEVQAAHHGLFQASSPVDGKRYKPHDDHDLVVRYEQLGGTKGEAASKLQLAVDAAWEATKDALKGRIAELFKDRPDMLEAVKANTQLYAEQPAS